MGDIPRPWSPRAVCALVLVGTNFVTHTSLSSSGAGGATSGGVAPTVKGPGYGQTMPGHDATGGFRPVLDVGPDLSEVTQPGLGQGNTFVTSWDDMRKK